MIGEKEKNILGLVKINNANKAVDQIFNTIIYSNIIIR